MHQGALVSSRARLHKKHAHLIIGLVAHSRVPMTLFKLSAHTTCTVPKLQCQHCSAHKNYGLSQIKTQAWSDVAKLQCTPMTCNERKSIQQFPFSNLFKAANSSCSPIGYDLHLYKLVGIFQTFYQSFAMLTHFATYSKMQCKVRQHKWHQIT